MKAGFIFGKADLSYFDVWIVHSISCHYIFCLAIDLKITDAGTQLTNYLKDCLWLSESFVPLP